MEKIKLGALQLCKWVTIHRSGIVFFAFIFVVLASLPSVAFASDLDDILSSSLSTLFEAVLGLLAQMLAVLLSVVGKLIVMVLGALIIPILGYNNFGDSAIIDIGWPLVRDVVNMFVIVVLLVIALQTIIGYSKAQWEAQLPRFFTAVVLVNFSRTICLIMIDVSQVIMFTFVNALRDIAAGNFMSLFQLNDFVVMGDTQTALGQTGVELYTMFAEFFVVLSLLLVVLGVLIILAVVYLYRIIVLWVLVILSPIAFFLGGITQLFGEAGGRYKEWWNMFTAALTLGPILTFFLWLGLAAASAGPIAVSEGLDFEGTEDIPTLLAEIFLSEKLVSLGIALILIMTGFKVASSAAQQLGNIAGKLVTEDVGKKMVKSALTLPASTAYRGARWTGKQAGRQIEGRFGVGQKLSKGLMGAGQAMAERGGFIGRAVGTRVMGAAGAVRRGAAAPDIAGREKAREEVQGMTIEERVARAGSVQVDPRTGKPQAMTLSEQRRQEALMLDATTDSTFRKKLKKDMDPDAYKQFMRASMQHVDKNKNELLTDDKQKKDFKKTKAGNLREWIDGKVAADPNFDTQKELNDIVSDSDFKVNQLSADDIADPEIRQALENKTVRSWTAPDGSQRTENMLDQLKAGRGVKDEVKNAALTGFTGDVNLDQASADQIAEAVRAGVVDAGNITADHVADPARAQEVANGLARGGHNMEGIDAAAQANIQAALRDLSTAAASVNDRRMYDTARLRSGEAATDVIQVAADGSMDANATATLREASRGNPDVIVNFQNHIQNAVNAGAGNDVTRAVTESYSRQDVDRLLQQYNAAQTDADRDNVRNIVDQMRSAVAAEGNRPAADRTVTNRELNNMARQMDLARREM